jgi:hypothetical protein
MKIKLFFSFILFIFFQLTQAQIKDSSTSYILSGTVVNGETNELLIGAHLVTNQYFGTKTDESGVFSINVAGNDTLKISFVGYKTLHYAVPFHEQGKYLIKFKLYTDSISLHEVEIFPWPNYDEFKKAFAELKSKEPEIKMEGVKMYQDRNIEPFEFPVISVFVHPLSFMYDKLLDKKAKLKRRLERSRKTIKESSIIEDDE